jgi:hypothetical protein
MLSLAPLRPARLSALAALALAGFAMPGLGGTATASRSQESVMQDDRVLYTQGPVSQARALDSMVELGVDTVHTLIDWRGLAPDPSATRPPRGFDADNPAAYPADRWNPIDDLVRGAQARGLKVLMTPTGPAPRWGEGCSDSERSKYPSGTCRPSAAKFGDFVEALARRYSGAYADESDGAKLPRVVRWSLFNEPNLGGWLSPQTRKVGGRTVIESAVRYRALVYSATAGLRAAGHSRDQVLLGETAPIGGGSNRTGPVRFYETLLCVDSRGRRLTGSAAKAAACRSGMRRLPVTGIAHHPYTRGAGEPLLKKQAATSITIAYTSRLRRLARLGAKTKLLSNGVASHIYFTEFGVSSDPPGKRFSVPLATQAEWINQADWIAYRDPSVRSVAQYGVEDDTTFLNDAFQTGLCFTNQPNPCYPKPAWDAYRVPVYVLDRGRNVQVFGQARPGGGNARQVIQIQNRTDANQAWRTVETVELSPSGYFLETVTKAPGSWRLSWSPRLGTTFFSREAVPRKR